MALSRPSRTGLLFPGMALPREMFVQEAPPPHLFHMSTVIPRGEITRCDAAPRLPLPKATVQPPCASIDIRILPFVRVAARLEGRAYAFDAGERSIDIPDGTAPKLSFAIEALS